MKDLKKFKNLGGRGIARTPHASQLVTPTSERAAMSKVVKKGYLDVKLSRLFGAAYRRKFVVLLNYSTRGLKAVDVMEDEFSADTAETIEVGEYGRIEVYERQSKNKGKYSFQVIISDEELTFSCDSDEERRHWIQSFNVLKQLAMCETTQPAPPPIPEYFPVVLVKNKYASDIGHSGEYFISIKDCTIILNWKTTRAIAYQWPRSTVVKFFLATEKKGQLVLNSSGSEGSLTEFIFTTEQENTAKEILGTWNICLLELINTSADKLNGSSLYIEGTDGRSKLIKRSMSVKTNAQGLVMRQRSERNRSHHKSSPPTVSKNHTLPPRGNLPYPGHPSTPPPPPPVDPTDSSDEDDDGPDYARIKDKKENPSVDDVLEELGRDIDRDKRAKKKPSVPTTMFPPLDPGSFPKKEPDDYTEPVPSMRPLPTRYNVSLLPQHPQSTSVSESDQEPFRVPSQPFSYVFDNRPMAEPPVPDRGVVSERGGGGNLRRSYTPGEEVTPTIPPRSWRKDSVTSITSSLPSSGSLGGLSNRSSGVHDDPDSPTILSGGRSGAQDDGILMSPPINLKRSIIQEEEESRTNTPNFNERPKGERCNGLKVRMAVGKTFSLTENPLCGQDKQQPLGSMPDLNNTVVAANGSFHPAAAQEGAASRSRLPGQHLCMRLSGRMQMVSGVIHCPSRLPVSHAHPSQLLSHAHPSQLLSHAHPSQLPSRAHPSPSSEPRAPLQKQDMYVAVEAQLSQPNTHQSQEVGRSLSVSRKGSVPEDRLVPRPNPVPSSELSQDEQKKTQSEFLMAMRQAQKVEADLSMLVRKPSTTDVLQKNTVTKTLSVIPSPLLPISRAAQFCQTPKWPTHAPCAPSQCCIPDQHTAGAQRLSSDDPRQTKLQGPGKQHSGWLHCVCPPP
ncbi:hypothetical protein EMCRGX_G020210 [Ephydatia muelleri]